MSIQELLVAGLDQQGGADIAVATLQVCRQQEAQDFAALVGLLRFDGVEGKLESRRRSQPGLRESELDGGRRRRVGSGSCNSHVLTVLLPTSQ